MPVHRIAIVPVRWPGAPYSPRHRRFCPVHILHVLLILPLLLHSPWSVRPSGWALATLQKFMFSGRSTSAAVNPSQGLSGALNTVSGLAVPQLGSGKSNSGT